MFPPLWNGKKSISDFLYTIQFICRKITEFCQNSNFLFLLQGDFLNIFPTGIYGILAGNRIPLMGGSQKPKKSEFST
jgi:hypothetical protein